MFSSSVLPASALLKMQAPASTAQVSSANTEVMASRASEVAGLGVFPIEVAMVVLGCLLASSFILLLRETRIEKRARDLS